MGRGANTGSELVPPPRSHAHQSPALAVLSPAVAAGSAPTWVMRFEDETFLVGHDSDPLDPAEIRPEDLRIVCLSCLIERYPGDGRREGDGGVSPGRRRVGGGVLRFCLDCNAHHPVAYKCPKVARKKYLRSRATRVRSTAAWQKARAAARQRDGQRCGLCPSREGLAVHHIVSLEDGGKEFELSNLITLCQRCHSAQHTGGHRRSGK